MIGATLWSVVLLVWVSWLTFLVIRLHCISLRDIQKEHKEILDQLGLQRVVIPGTEETVALLKKPKSPKKSKKIA